VMFDIDDNKKKTKEAFENPRVGDLFHEMYSFWVFVVLVSDTHVAIMYAIGPCEFPADAITDILTRDEYAKRFQYSESNKDYSVMFRSHDNNVEGWYKEENLRLKTKCFPNGMTVKELKEIVKNLPEKNKRTGEDYGVWIGTREDTSNEVKEICPLNFCDGGSDIIFEPGS